jgi:hypothetical protein
MASTGKKRCEQLRVLHPDAAGIDVGASELFVAVSADRHPQPVRRFPTFTRDLNALADSLESCGVHSVAMESTSVYWIPVYQILETRGFEVYLVNAQHVKNAPGRKTDVSDCQWIQYLHSVGLLRASFRPPGAICTICCLWRHRVSLIQMAAEHVLHMQKALDQMNVQIHRVLNDITGLLLLAGSSSAQEAGSGFDLRANMTVQAVFSPQLTSVPRSGGAAAAGCFRRTCRYSSGAH